MKQRLWQIGFLMNLLLILSLVVMGMTPQTRFFKSINTEKLCIVDANGTVRAKLEVTKDGSVGVLIAPKNKGAALIAMTVSSDGAAAIHIGRGDYGSNDDIELDGITIVSNDKELGSGIMVANSGIPSIEVFQDPDGQPMLNLLDSKGNPGLELNVRKDGTSAISAKYEGGKPAIAILAAKDGSSVSLSDKSFGGNLRVSSDLGASLSFFDINNPLKLKPQMILQGKDGTRFCLFRDGTERVSICTNEIDNEYVSLRGKNEKSRVLITAKDEGEPLIGLINNDGKVLWSAP
ncbi:MAG TPA: hypothetical protein VMX94_10305 [Armatimonadota bacterium]|nr:hypothetical protein [Armatimonadota bacterium]